MTRKAPYARVKFSHDTDSWRTRAACRNTDPDLLFPARAEDEHEAAKVCRTCPVVAECLGDALDQRITDGVWGGTTGRQRALLLTRRPGVTNWRELLVRERDARGGAA